MTATYLDTSGAREVTLQDLYFQVSLLLDRLDYGMMTDPAKRLKVNLSEAGTLPGVTTVSTVTTVSSVTSVADQGRVGGVPAYRLIEAALDTAYCQGILANVTF